jgi:hypothetical protein
MRSTPEGKKRKIPECTLTNEGHNNSNALKSHSPFNMTATVEDSTCGVRSTRTREESFVDGHNGFTQ